MHACVRGPAPDLLAQHAQAIGEDYAAQRLGPGTKLVDRVVMRSGADCVVPLAVKRVRLEMHTRKLLVCASRVPSLRSALRALDSRCARPERAAIASKGAGRPDGVDRPHGPGASYGMVALLSQFHVGGSNPSAFEAQAKVVVVWTAEAD